MKRVVAALIVRDGKILVCQRTKHQTMPLKWEFPGGKIEKASNPGTLCGGNWMKNSESIATIGDEVARIRHEYRRKFRRITLFRGAEFRGELENRIFRDNEWAERTELRFDFRAD